MPIYLNGETQTVPTQMRLDDLTPRQIVAELDKYVVGQNNAKRAVAVALRNRIRRQKLPPEIAQDVLPKNIYISELCTIERTDFFFSYRVEKRVNGKTGRLLSVIGRQV